MYPYEENTNKLSELGEELYRLGAEGLKNKSFGVVVLAGGQGSRLGSDIPKALFKIANKPLIEHHILRIKRLIKDFHCNVTLFIMVSSYTENQIREYVENNNLGIPVKIVKQEDRICKDTEGNPLCDENGNVIKAPGGNGDVFKAFKGVDLREIVCLNVISVDNVLAKVLDPVFIGAFIKYNTEVLSKAVIKKADENVGVFVIQNNKLKVREYIDLKEDEKSVQGNICNHLFSRRFMEAMQDKELPEHNVLKKIPFLKDGSWKKPSAPNGYKTETFIFDSFEYAENNDVIIVPREYEFAPLKNGNDSKKDNPDTCEQALRQYG
ncbi:putative UDP-N-acetylglucosamine pyrophosphorylase [Nosema granulosis]|uniref:UDP-N-acetylglucosamine diphosphorylase n=1 Tax=Nosema granulosis TaxID=83296 RepID=A0A9P6GYR0_9MICR|nr:putative UDP-N-acetylglucosamine pyrophosphorylase [Nosema granulosis]